MKSPIIFCLVILFVEIFSANSKAENIINNTGCINTIPVVLAENSKQHSSYTDTTATSSTVEFLHTNLSTQFDIKLRSTRFFDTDNHFNDSSVVQLILIDKINGRIIDNLQFVSLFYFSDVFQDSTNVLSYTTGVNVNREIVDNYFGDIVVADFNFDNKDDIAIIGNSGGNGGPIYRFYMQGQNKKFLLNEFLTDTMEFLPREIDKQKKTLTTYVHASAVSLCKSVYHFNLNTNKWRRVSRTFIGY